MKNGINRIYKITSLALISLLLLNCGEKPHTKPTLFVSVAPQKYFVDKICGDEFNVEVMVPSGFSPATYEPLPSQMMKLKNSEIFFRTGVPFEERWLDRIAALNNEIKIIDLREGIKLREIEGHAHGEDDGHGHSEHHYSHMDPHIWLSPELVKRQSETIYNAVSVLQPEQKELFSENREKLLIELRALQSEIERILGLSETKEFLVFHPSWGYFADEFGLRQIAIERSGKEPGAAELAELISSAREKNLKSLIVQKQFASSAAKVIAEEIGIELRYVDPLSEDYLENLLKTAKIISGNYE